MQHLLLDYFTAWNCKVILYFLYLTELVEDKTILGILLIHAIYLGFFYDSLTYFVTIPDLEGITMSCYHFFEKCSLNFKP